MPAIPRARRHPGERGQHARDGGSDHRRLPADGEHVRADDENDEHLSDDSRQPQEPGQREHARGEERDVLPRDGEQMVEAGRAEVVPGAGRQILVLSEHDTEHDAATDAARAAAHRALHAFAQSVAEPQDPASATDLPPVRRAEHDVDALVGQPGALVEAVLLRARLGDADARLQDRAARRRTSHRQLQEDPLAYRLVAEAPGLREHSGRKRRRARRSEGDDAGVAGPVQIRPRGRFARARPCAASPSRAPPPRARGRERRGGATRRAPPRRHAPTRATAIATHDGTETQTARAIPTQAEPTSRAGQWSAATRATT